MTIQNNNSKVILITGCSSGFGLLAAARLAARGDNIFAGVRNLEKSGSVENEVALRGGKVEILQLDVTQKDSIHESITKIAAKHGYIDVLVNNAGYGVGGFFEDLTEKEIRDQMETNFFGLQNVTREVIPLMRARKQGKIINISSVSGFYGSPAFSAYSASKWAVESFSESLRYELKPFGIDVLLIEPGTYRTNIFYRQERFCKNFDNPDSPYFDLSQHLRKRVMNHVEASGKNPEVVAQLIEQLIDAKSPAFRNTVGWDGQVLYLLRRFLPFNVFSKIMETVLYRDYKSKSHPHPLN